VSIGLAGCNQAGTIEVEDNATEDDIQERVRDEVFNVVEWGWSEDNV
jgi:hypothetical protein